MDAAHWFYLFYSAQGQVEFVLPISHPNQVMSNLKKSREFILAILRGTVFIVDKDWIFMNFYCGSPDSLQRKERFSDYKFPFLPSLSTMLECEWLLDVPTKKK